MILKYPLILASNSVRRHELLSSLGITFQIYVRKVNECFPPEMNPMEVASFLAQKKCNTYKDLFKNNIVITSDTVVILENKILGKPNSEDQAKEMLNRLSGNKHLVVSGMSLGSPDGNVTVSDATEVLFDNLNKRLIDEYVVSRLPMDKAGAYGVQDWFGMIAVKRIIGSFYTIMGMPMKQLYEELLKFRVS